MDVEPTAVTLIGKHLSEVMPSSRTFVVGGAMKRSSKSLLVDMEASRGILLFKEG